MDSAGRRTKMPPVSAPIRVNAATRRRGNAEIRRKQYPEKKIHFKILRMMLTPRLCFPLVDMTAQWAFAMKATAGDTSATPQMVHVVAKTAIANVLANGATAVA